MDLEKMLCAGRARGGNGGHVPRVKDTTSRGLYGRVWPPRTVNARGAGEIVSKEVGEEERVLVRRSGQEERQRHSRRC